MTVELLKQATKRVVGNKQTAKAIQKGTAKTVYIADDADVRVVQPLLDAGELVLLSTLLPRMWRHFSLLQRAGHRQSPTLAAFVQTCQAHARGTPA